MGKPSGLYKRKSSSSWRYRQRWPKRFRTPTSPPQIDFSLKTADYSEALSLYDDARQVAQLTFRGEAVAQLHDPAGISATSKLVQWPDAPHLPQLTAEVAKNLAQEFFYRAMLDIDREPPTSSDMDDDAQSRQQIELEDRLAELKTERDEGLADPIIGAEIAILTQAGYAADHVGQGRASLRAYVWRAMVQLGEVRLARHSGIYNFQVSDSLFDPLSFRHPIAKIPSTIGRRSETKVGEGVDRYIAEVVEVDLITPKTTVKYRALLRHIADFFGRETYLCDVQRADCIRFRNAIAKLPPNHTKRNPTGMTLEEFGNAKVWEQTLTRAAQHNYLKMADKFFKWCMKEHLVPDNVAEDVTPLKKRVVADMQRLPFKGAELEKIFLTPTFTGSVDDRHNFRKPGPNILRRSRYWLPLLGLFSGLRMGEILQLTTGHIRKSAKGINFFVLTPDMTLKTINAEREIPIHPELIRIGFLDWVTERRDANEDDLFDDVEPSKHGYRSDTFSKRFATYLKHVDLPVSRKDRLCFHSFRHTFKDALTEANVPESDVDELCGWSRGKRTGRRYGSGISADRLYPHILAVQFDVDLSHL
ncbi:MAG: phage integrase family protein [Sphingomonadales bacterium]|nr:phage integrase family protein [Sphingomonadales bacterium]